MAILTLDFGNRSGWATMTDKRDLLGSGYYDLEKVETGERFKLYEDLLYTLISKYRPITSIFYEHIAFAKGIWKMQNGMYWGIVHRVGYEKKIPVYGVSPLTIKDYLTGNKKATKQDMIKSVNTQGYKVEDDNEADAIALALYAIRDIRA